MCLPEEKTNRPVWNNTLFWNYLVKPEWNEKLPPRPPGRWPERSLKALCVFLCMPSLIPHENPIDAEPLLGKNDSHAARGWLLEHLVAPAAGQERSHAAWRSFCSKTMLPMQRGARSGPRGWRQLQTIHQTNNQANAQTIKQTINQTNHQTKKENKRPKRRHLI